MGLGDFSSTVNSLIEVLDALGIEYRVGGSVASSRLGEFRATNDIDIVADIKKENVGDLVARLKTTFFVDEDSIGEDVQRSKAFNLLDRQTFLKVDIFPIRARAYDKVAFTRKLRGNFGEDNSFQVNFLSVEDTILSKLECFRLGGQLSERQWADVLGVIRNQSLDYDYLGEWASQIGVEDLLQTALEQVKKESDNL